MDLATCLPLSPPPSDVLPWLYRVSVVSGNWSKSWSVKLLTLFFSSLFLLLFAENSSMDKSIYFFKK